MGARVLINGIRYKRYQRGARELSSLLAETLSTLILQERRDAGLPFRIVLEQHAEHGDAPHALGLVCARRERPRGARTVWRAAARYGFMLIIFNAEHLLAASKSRSRPKAGTNRTRP